MHARTHARTHPFNGPFSGTTRVGRYQKGKTNLDFTEARDSEWQWHQLGHMHNSTKKSELKNDPRWDICEISNIKCQVSCIESSCDSVRLLNTNVRSLMRGSKNRNYRYYFMITRLILWESRKHGVEMISQTANMTSQVFTARCYASAVLAMALCLSVRHKSEFY